MMASGTGNGEEALLRNIRVTWNGRQYIYDIAVSPYPAIGNRATSTERDSAEESNASRARNDAVWQLNNGESGSAARTDTTPSFAQVMTSTPSPIAVENEDSQPNMRSGAAASNIHRPGRTLKKAHAIQEQDSEYKHLTYHEILYGLEAGRYVPSNHLYGGILLKVRCQYEPKQICQAINAKRAMEIKAMTPDTAANRHGSQVKRNNITKRLNSAVVEREKAIARMEMRQADVSAALIQFSVDDGKSQAAAETQQGQKGCGKKDSPEVSAVATSNKRKRDSSDDELSSNESNSSSAERLYKKRKAHSYKPYQQFTAISNTSGEDLDNKKSRRMDQRRLRCSRC